MKTEQIIFKDRNHLALKKRGNKIEEKKMNKKLHTDFPGEPVDSGSPGNADSSKSENVDLFCLSKTLTIDDDLRMQVKTASG